MAAPAQQPVLYSQTASLIQVQLNGATPCTGTAAEAAV
jgi:hypothetical protein